MAADLIAIVVAAAVDSMIAAEADLMIVVAAVAGTMTVVAVDMMIDAVAADSTIVVAEADLMIAVVAAAVMKIDAVDTTEGMREDMDMDRGRGKKAS